MVMTHSNVIDLDLLVDQEIILFRVFYFITQFLICLLHTVRSHAVLAIVYVLIMNEHDQTVSTYFSVFIVSQLDLHIFPGFERYPCFHGHRITTGTRQYKQPTATFKGAPY